MLAVFRHPRILPVYWVALSLLIIAVDHLTDPYIQFPILFLLPVTLASVYNGRWWGVGLAVSMPVIRCFFEIVIVPWAETQEMINTGINLIVLAGTGSVSCNSVFVLHLCRFLDQEELMEREAMVQNP